MSNQADGPWPAIRGSLICLFLLVAATVGTSYSDEPLIRHVDVGPEQTDSTIQPVLLWNERSQAPRPLAASFMRIDLRNPRLEVVVMVGDDPDGSGPAEAALTMPVALIEKHGALAGVNANAFARVRREDRSRPWTEGMPVDIVGIALSDGVTRSPLDNPNRSNSRLAFWLDNESTPRLGRPAESTEVVQAVGDFCAVLLREGKVVPEEGGPRHPRTALGFDEAKRSLLLVVVDGRRKGYSDGMTMRELAVLMREHGCRDAINMDGGGSSVMLYRESASAEIETANRPSGGSHRPIPVMIGVRPTGR